MTLKNEIYSTIKFSEKYLLKDRKILCYFDFNLNFC
jgi:hypothetical protein